MGFSTRCAGQTVRSRALDSGPEEQFERLWTAKSIPDSDARAEKTKSFEGSSIKVSSSGISLKVSPRARKETTSMHNREIKRIGLLMLC